MKKTFMTFTIVFGLITIINAQGITNTLGGNTAGDKFIVENSDLEELLVVTGEGNVGIGTASPLSKLSVGGNGYSWGTIYGETAEWEGRAVSGYASNSDVEINYGGWFRANGEYGSGVYGFAANTGNYTNYGGYFKAAGVDGRGVYGGAPGNRGRGVYGIASNTGDNISNYGGFFRANGEYGSGVYGFAVGGYGRGVSGYAAGRWGNGVYGLAGGDDGSAISGYASNTGNVTNYGGYFKAAGTNGRGVYGEASNTGNVTNYGGFFKADGDDGRAVYGRANGTNGIAVYGRGSAYDFWAHNGTYGNSSSIRWKSNIVEIDNPLEKLAEMRGVYFDWDEEHGGSHTVGMIAEEVGKVLPEIVFYEANGIDAKGMDYSKLTPLLVEAIKALQKRVEELENR